MIEDHVSGYDKEVAFKTFVFIQENKNIPVENEIGNKIWDKIENQCIKVHKRIVPLELIQ